MYLQRSMYTECTLAGGDGAMEEEEREWFYFSTQKATCNQEVIAPTINMVDVKHTVLYIPVYRTYAPSYCTSLAAASVCNSVA